MDKQTYAVIDMGSNSVRLMLAEVEDGKLKGATKELAMTRLGAGVDTSKMLSEASMKATLEALKDYKTKAEAAGAVMLGAFATSAVRDALNGKAFAERALMETGVAVNIIPGDQEALLGYKGVLSGLPADLKDKRFLIIDIGGGSTELIVGTTEGILYRHSFNVGTVRMTGKHISTDPVSESEAQALKADVSQILFNGIREALMLRPEVAIGIGGTATTFGAMDVAMTVYDREQIQGLKVKKDHLQEIIQTLKVSTVAQKCMMPGLMPKRADVIYAGGVILMHLLETFSLEGFIVSDYDNLEGILADRGLLK